MPATTPVDVIVALPPPPLHTPVVPDGKYVALTVEPTHTGGTSTYGQGAPAHAGSLSFFIAGIGVISEPVIFNPNPFGPGLEMSDLTVT